MDSYLSSVDAAPLESRDEIERLTSGSERGGWKSAARQLAGRLPYGTHGFVAEAGGVIPSPTVTGMLTAFAPLSVRR